VFAKPGLSTAIILLLPLLILVNALIEYPKALGAEV
jgi:hypothetical protein